MERKVGLKSRGLATSIYAMLTSALVAGQVNRARMLDLSDIQDVPARSLRREMKKRPRGRAGNPAGSKLSRKLARGTLIARHPSAVDAHFAWPKSHQIGRRLGV
jgi:hypothetical protein